MHKDTYNNLAKFLSQHGYNVEKKYRKQEKEYSIDFPPYTEYYITGKNIVACFCTPNHEFTYPYINGKIAADHKDCFDKWSKCPLVMNIDGIEYNQLLKELELLGSEEGFNISNSFGDNVFTYQMDDGWYNKS